MKNTAPMPRIVIAGTHSGAGKTSVTMGVIRALRKHGQRVQAFKVGPDYIDPGWHLVASGQASHNLDTWMGTAAVAEEVFGRHAAAADIAVIEGVMGLYDGVGPEDMTASTAEVAMLLEAPVILVADGRGIGPSIIAMVKGYRDYLPGLKLAGVIINRGGDYHRWETAPVLEKELGIAVLGSLPYCSGIELPERHLGLLPAQEKEASEEVVAALAGLVEQYIDLDKLQQIAAAAPARELRPASVRTGPAEGAVDGAVVIAVARDEAFSFYYEDNLDFLRETGAELRYFSPLHDSRLPPAHGLILGGGFPEMFLPELEANQAMGSALREAIRGGWPVWAECGGYMYLCDCIIDFEGRRWPGLGVVPGTARMGRRLAGMGYRRASALAASPLALPGDLIKGHEFHYASMELVAAGRPAYAFTRTAGGGSWPEGYASSSLSASFLHIHLRSNPRAALRFVDSCRSYAEGNAHTEGNTYAEGNAHTEGNTYAEGNAHTEGNAHAEGNAHTEGNVAGSEKGNGAENEMQCEVYSDGQRGGDRFQPGCKFRRTVPGSSPGS